MDILQWVKDKGIFLTFRIGKKPFNGIPKKRTTAYDDIIGGDLKRRKDERNKLEDNSGVDKKVDRDVQ